MFEATPYLGIWLHYFIWTTSLNVPEPGRITHLSRGDWLLLTGH
jgi:hypothetical protein